MKLKEILELVKLIEKLLNKEIVTIIIWRKEDYFKFKGFFFL